jgi:hypothetical protein
MTDFYNLINNKSIALVGPAGYMKGGGFGKDIDSHDYIVRLNRGIECVNSRQNDLGSRTDILYSCMIEAPENTGVLDAESLQKEHLVKFIVAPPESDIKGKSKTTRLHPMANQNTVNQIIQRIPFRIIDHVFHTHLASKVNCRPNTGFLAIYDLLRHNPLKLSLYGFSFYLDGFDPDYKSDLKVKQKDYALKCFNSNRHVQKNMWKYAKDTLLNDSKVFLDPTLKKILKLYHFNKEEYEKY